ncbi:MAG: hypothetical protein WA001_03730 [Patescibacteria group bacterium]
MDFENPFLGPSSQRPPSSRPPASENAPSSKRLRELAAQLERADEESVRTEIEEHVTELIQPGLKIGEGQIADVYCGRQQDDMEGYCIKHKARVINKSTYENSLKKEMDIQSEAYRILEEARAAGTPVARIPRPWLYLKTRDGREILSMDRVPGKTFYRFMLEKAAEKMPDDHFLPGTNRSEIPDLRDEDLEEMVLVRFLKMSSKTRNQLYQALVEKAGDPPFLPTETAIKLRNSIKALNAKKLFHRDLHEKNLMLSDDLSEVYLIDFGSASYKEHSDLTDATETERIGTKLRYQRDDGILSTVTKLAKKPPKRT